MILMLYMAICGGYAGGSLPYSNIFDKEISVFGRKINFTWLPEVLFALPFAYQDSVLLGVLAFVWSYLWMQSATAPGLHWGNINHYNQDRTSTLKPFVDWINRMTIKADPSTAAYCRLYMAVKGFLIGLPTGPCALITAILWPVSYEIGVRLGRHWVSECLTGVSAATAIIIGGLL